MEAVLKNGLGGEVMQSVFRHRLLSAFLLVVNVALLLLIWMEWQKPQAELMPSPREDVSVAPPELPPSPLRALSLNRYHELLERPLFWSERKSLQEETADSLAPVLPNSQLSLLGVVASPQANYVLLQRAGSNEVVRAQLGDVIDGWQLESISANGVILQRNNERQRLLLDEKRNK